MAVGFINIATMKKQEGKKTSESAMAAQQEKNYLYNSN